MKLEIEKNIAIPPIRHDSKYAAVDAMEPGDSVRVKDKRQISAIRQRLARRFGTGTVVAQRQEKGGYRIWRVK